MTSGRLVSPPPSSTRADKLAFVVSAVASPFLVLPVFLFILAVHTCGTLRAAVYQSAVATAGMVIVPAGYVLRGVRTGAVTDVHVQMREQRRGPFIAAIAGCALAVVLLALIRAEPPLILAAAAAVANGLLFLAITLRWKISMHPSTLTACALMAGRLVHPLWLLALVTLPLVLWARVRRGRHTWGQGAAAITLAAGVTELFVEAYLASGGASYR
ncbi:MAG: hypothetical protein HZB16_09645 [Armatimonadetes bacterium]|nr:hypothetical protein [Armatimonadota bacterium]